MFIKKEPSCSSHLCQRAVGQTKSILWIDKSKTEPCGQNLNHHASGKAKTAYTKKKVKHSRRNVNMCGCLSSSGPGWLNNQRSHWVYEDIAEQNAMPSVMELKLGWKWIVNQTNDLKHSSKTTKRQRKKKIRRLDWQNQSLDLNLIQMLWLYLKW